MPDILRVNQMLNPGDKLISANGTFNLKFQTDGNLVLYVVSSSILTSGLTGETTQINRAIWNTFTQNKGATHCVLRPDGNFVIYKAGGDTPENALISTKTTDGDHLVVQDDGNVVLYSPSNKPVWQSGTSVGEAGGVNFNGPDLATPGTRFGEALHIGGTLNFGDQLRSANGTFVLKFQLDGNLVLFVDSTSDFAGVVNRAIWNSGTANKGATHCVLQTDGNFVIYKVGGDIPRNAVFSRIGTVASDLVVQDDGNVAAYNFVGPPFSLQWQVGTSVGQTPGANTNAPLPAGGV